jgi:hypothetical protein
MFLISGLISVNLLSFKSQYLSYFNSVKLKIVFLLYFDSECLNLYKFEVFSLTDARDVESYWEQQSEFEGGYTEALLLWKNIEPLYQKLHAFVYKQLSRHYAFLRSKNSTVIPAHLLGSTQP